MTLHRPCAVALLAAAALPGAVLRGAPGPTPVAAFPTQACGSSSEPALVEHHYTLNARVRPFLIWIARSHVGSARIGRSHDAAGVRRFELLIGSDPDRAPMRINRWGYLAETVCGAETHVAGVMTETKEQSLDEARVVREPDGRHAFTAIRSTVTGRETIATVTRFVLSEALTYRDVGSLLQRPVPVDAPVRRLSLPEGTTGGFMTVVSGLLDESVTEFRRAGRLAGTGAAARVYTYNAQLYDVRIPSSRLLKAATINGRPFEFLLESEFEIRNRTTRERTGFRLTYGTQGVDAGTPLRIVYRPKWWFEAELLFERSTDATGGVLVVHRPAASAPARIRARGGGRARESAGRQVCNAASNL
jgi:hypothetical protein